MKRSTAIATLAALSASLLTIACGGGSGSSSTTAPAPAPPPTGVSTLQTIDNVVGTGALAAVGSNVTLNYTGWLYSATAADNKGTQFDTSLTAGRTPLAFRIGSGQVIPGFEQGVTGMRVGGTRTILIPSSLGYGAAGAGSAIPPNSSLVFTVILLSVN